MFGLQFGFEQSSIAVKQTNRKDAIEPGLCELY